ncbi:MAG: DUF5916 domain-containing protein [Candidatus Zhuqueibacterota bacterium]
MKTYLATMLGVLLFTSAVAADQSKQLILRKVTEPISVDGIIDPAWASADSVSDFIQQQPYHNQQATRRTVARLVTSEDALYCMMICYDDEANIQKQKGKLDESGGDIVSLMLDTFDNKQTAYKFAVSATGVKADCRLLDDARNRDYSWDGIWFSGSKIYPWGFVVEMEIPYKSIQYDATIVEWGLDFDRWMPVRNEDIYWCSYEENEGQRISKFGRLVFNDFRPTVKGLHLEIYPVAIAKSTYQGDNSYKTDPDAGLDIFYNPSPELTFQLTANPDFAQIEADPFEFNISRYESYFSERRPFFTEGNEIFMASGRQRNTGFYRPMELFYSRRIGKKLPDGNEVPLVFGTKAFGRMNTWEYGGFMAVTGKTDYRLDGEDCTEDQAYFGSARVKKQILGNSSVGMMIVGKHSQTEDNGVIDIDGAFRTSSWQLAYQIARSFKNNQGDFGGSAGFLMFSEKSMVLIRGRYIGDNFDIDQVGFVPWKGTGEFVGIAGPRWYFQDGYIRSILIYGGGYLDYEKVDNYTDYGGALGYNMQFRDNWGFEISLDGGDAKDGGVRFSSYTVNFNSWSNVNPKLNAFLGGGYSRTYNFSRGYLASYSWSSLELNYLIFNSLQIGSIVNMFIEYNPDRAVEDITLNARPHLSVTPINNLNVRVYLDNVFLRSSEQVEQAIFGLLFSYNFSPKSWIYFAINDIRDRSLQFGESGELLPQRMHVVDRAGVFKLKYLYYF